VWSSCYGREEVLSGMKFGDVFLEGNYVYLSSVAGGHTVIADVRHSQTLSGGIERFCARVKGTNAHTELTTSIYAPGIRDDTLLNNRMNEQM
jgi:hypothetical protein